MIKPRLGMLLIHIVGCAVFLALPILFSPGSYLSIGALNKVHTQRELLSYVLMIVFFYTNILVLIPKLYFNKSYILFALAAFTGLIIITYLPVTIMPHENFGTPDMHHRPPPPHDKPFFSEVGHNFFLFLAVFFVSFTISVNNRWKKVEQERTNAELSYLKAQINPHFLFNTLNSIYSLAIEKSDKTATAVVKLSEMMRYVITEAASNFVTLGKEVSYVTNYIELQRLRLGHTATLNYTVEGHTEGKKIAPLLLITFIENAFKYGVNPERISTIIIEIKIQEKDIALFVMNHKVNMVHKITDKSGLGIENTRKRLNLVYPGNHTLAVNDQEDTFSVTLNISLS